jgi:C-terminal processing protease CtpA/Prc
MRHTYFPIFIGLVSAVLLAACTGTRHGYQANRKFSAAQLQQDVDLAWQTLQQVHPSYNWYTPAEEVNRRFAEVRAAITDSLTEAEFRLRLSHAVAAIRCGHTSVLASKAAAAASNRSNAGVPPLQVRVWGADSVVVVRAAGPGADSIRPGMIITAIDSVPIATLLRQLYAPISVDGYNPAFAEAVLSATFAARLRWHYGPRSHYLLSLQDSNGQPLQARLRMPAPRLPDTAAARQRRVPAPAVPRAPAYGTLQWWPDGQTAYLQLNSFSGKGVGRFIRRSFRRIDSAGARHLIIDLRDNSGGKISNSVLLGRYVAHRRFRVADSVSAVSFNFPKAKQVQAHLFYRLFSWAFTSRQPDGRLHMRRLERHQYRPRRRHHFSGPLYVLTSGRTFSASVLFLNYLYQRPLLTVVGTETGGGVRGNSAVMTPNLTLPNSQVRVRLPLFRLVTRAGLPVDGRGFVPHVLVQPSAAAIRYRRDAVLDTVRTLISAANAGRE